MKRISTLLLGLLLLSPFLSHAQPNLVINGDFEDGGSNYNGTPASFAANVDDWVVGCAGGWTPDIFDPNNTNCLYDMPSNHRSVSRTVNNNGTRYTGFGVGETILGKLSQPIADCSYEVSFAISPQGTLMHCPGSTPNNLPTNTQYTEIQLFLRSSANPCGPNSIMIWQSQPIQLTPDGNAPWQTITGTFSLTQAQLAQGPFDMVEVRQNPIASSGIKWVYFDDFSIKEYCCPDELELEIDCDRGEIHVLNVPQGATVTETTWYRKRKITAAGVEVLSAPANVSQYNPTSSGYYTVVMTIVLPNGFECTVSGTIFYSEEDCCQLLHPDGLQAWIAANNNVIGYETIYSPIYGYIEVPIICNESREYYFNTDVCPNLDGWAITNGAFNVNTWSDDYTIWSDAGSGQLPTTITLNSSQYDQNVLNNLTIYVSDPSLNPTNQMVNILFLAHHPDYCSGQLGKAPDGARKMAEAATVTIEQLAPNPTTDYTTVSLSEATSGTLNVYTVDGRLVLSQAFDNQLQITLQTNKLPSGMYLVQLTTEHGNILKKLVKE